MCKLFYSSLLTRLTNTVATFCFLTPFPREFLQEVIFHIFSYLTTIPKAHSESSETNKQTWPTKYLTSLLQALKLYPLVVTVIIIL